MLPLTFMLNAAHLLRHIKKLEFLMEESGVESGEAIIKWGKGVLKRSNIRLGLRYKDSLNTNIILGKTLLIILKTLNPKDDIKVF